MGKGFKDLEERPNGKMHIDSIRATLKNVPNRKTQGLHGIRGYRFIKDSLPSTINWQSN